MKPHSILLVDDDAAFRRVMASELGRRGYDVAAASSGDEALAKIAQVEPEVVLLDLRMPGMNGLEALKAIRNGNSSPEVILVTGHGTIDTAIEAIRIGAFDYVLKPCPLDELSIRIERALERRSLRHRANLLERALTPADPGDAFIGESPEFRRVLRLIERVAPGDSTVLITGETGSGKEMAAKLIHARSERRLRPFVIVECAALQESLLQSELFGHEKGAFTGADRAKPGLFEAANKGTVFLDEIGEVSPATQVKLLRVLDTSTFRRVGGTAEIHVNVRILAATNRDVPAMVRQGLFREDLYYRLSTIRLEIPPLRERASDIELLAQEFVRTFNERFGSSRRIGEEALRILRAHSWPGNVRELLHAVEAAMVVCEGETILPEHLPAPVRAPMIPSAPAPAAGVPQGQGIPTLDQLERSHIRRALEASQGRRSEAARILGISERNLYRKLRDYGLDR